MTGASASSGLFLTVPTAGSHPRLMHELVSNSALPLDQIIVVRTAPHAYVPSGCTVIDDFNGINIQRWWNLGISEAISRGASAVAVSNDDVSLSSSTLAEMNIQLQKTGATLATPSRTEFSLGLHKKVKIPYQPVLWGSLWVLDANSALRPDERYIWWYGDNDLDIRARRDYTGIVSCGVEFSHHHAGASTSMSPVLQAAAELDAQTFLGDYDMILKRTRWHRMSLSEKGSAFLARVSRIGSPSRGSRVPTDDH